MTSDNSVDETKFEVKCIRGITALVQVEIEPVGQCFHQYEYSRIHGVNNDIASDNSDDSKEANGSDIKIEDDMVFLKSLDPAKWKDQDHYQVLGLQKYRLKATDEDIKKAHRHMVLRHHPDKRRGRGEKVTDGDDYFTNIIRAYETLGDTIKRRAFDSVDPLFDDSVPGEKLNNKTKFYNIFGPVFERNSRWSIRKHVPQLGKAEDFQDTVELFYDFWYNFDSWREFSYLDEEDKEKGEDRDERKWIERQNKAERLVRKKEENCRIRKLVDNAYKLDPRIAQFKTDGRDKRLAVKKAKQDAIRQKFENEQKEKEKIETEERLIKEKEEVELKERQIVEKRQRDATKKALQKERKVMRTMCKECDYFITEDRDRVQAMMDVETLCDGLQLLNLRDLLQEVKDKQEDKVESRKIIKQLVDDLRTGKIENLKLSQSIGGGGSIPMSSTPRMNGSSHKMNGNSSKAKETIAVEWSSEELQLLIKAVNLFPAGTSKRWDVVAQYLSQHGPIKNTRPSKEVLSKAKGLHNSENSQQMKEAANKASLSNITSDATKGDDTPDAEASQRLETPQEMLGINLSPWSAEEQSLLEQALKTYPTTAEDRWVKIATCIPDRSKRECIRRYKELAEMIKAKKAAMKAAGVNKK